MFTWLIASIVFLYGIVIGSFLNVVIYRLPTGEFFKSSRSRCPHCHHTLQAIDLIPLVSYLVLGGKCRYCSGAIAWRYPLVELLNGCAYLGVYALWGLQTRSLVHMLLMSVLIVIAFIDIDTRRIPNILNICLVLLAIARIVTRGVALQSALWGCLVGFGFAVFCLSLALVFKRSLIGMGDLKFIVAIGLFVGFPQAIALIMLSFILAGFVTMALLLTRRLTLQEALPFGPFLALASGIICLQGEHIIQLLL